jgi:hypothetical protein
MNDDQSQELAVSCETTTATASKGKELHWLVRDACPFSPCSTLLQSVVADGFHSNLLAGSILLLAHLAGAAHTLIINLPYSAGTWGNWLRQSMQAFVKAAGETLHAHGTQVGQLAVHHSSQFCCNDAP